MKCKALANDSIRRILEFDSNAAIRQIDESVTEGYFGT
ncbi:MAG: hypothetical protein UV61_C0010G0005 [Candidatus Gottesmanbacteria bacterium GW2011_GWB1_43_11]|uniref:Uncharacterized protein n=1 Tax=Candidatus Gottesmanbacteria bacterium GW2011_GWB1_43_11 TaxID=1618446 RepID=A0A0G1CLS5_9BACT|nr:MAG: hypothetical protein UV04_C0012G0005 [Candidatus Gottesmanbacteria bacterium GW2011_GWA2_42_16]KKS53520.1 MAG: hypothetical protein UV17_C0035G0005 [Candidatus Gottesmanbacteria bacterium GW2011_GWA1_42_26]KKS81195.1 MAG: hypothetical protein UV55_C0018G0005 [Candidatus Gottesmanbacteria bacterium GW2011_GWC1_43_10]KKS86454.1 MAG: hypothetical protein UV61_C0010G0005 [Candidatus Gottesmanbacteria bacterium GW2011_GWB1_43_11]